MYAVQARHLRKTYQTGKVDVPVLFGIDLDVRAGEFVSIMGPSGSGKSTLLNMIGLLDTPTSGGLRVMGQSVAKLNKNQRALARREHLGFVFQSFHLLPRATTLQNVMLPMALAGVPRRERRPKAMALLEQVGLGDRARHRSNELSGGQKQRVALARALALDPPIILADEPTGNLDSETSMQVMGLLRDLNRQGRTIIQVTHEASMASFGDRILHVQDGVIMREQRRPQARPGRTNLRARRPRPASGGEAGGDRA
ncbi:MAG: ABC transporter ATP-binding protein [Thermoplasmatota archaeon]